MKHQKCFVLHFSSVTRFYLLSNVFILLTCLTLVGCEQSNPTTYPVAGTVFFEEGKPVGSGYIEFIPTQGGTSARGRLDKDGNFTLGTYSAEDGALLGEYKVVIIQPEIPTTVEQTRRLGFEHSQHADNTSRVPLKYADPATSDLKYTVQSNGQNIFRIILKRSESTN